jgi:hypothetical protein
MDPVLNTKRLLKMMPAVLALLAILFWPALAGATCCCKRAATIAAATGSDAACCCAEDRPSCCCVDSTCSTHPQSCVEQQECRCDLDCCQADLQRLRLLVPEDTARIAILDDHDALHDFAYPIKAVDFPLPTRETFRSAPDHCAQVCVWLK